MAARHAGITPLWSSEIKPFPCAVTAKHFPEVRQLGDITKLDGAELPPVDIITAGSPCQDLSIAGKQEGLKGARSGLFRDAIGLVRDMRRATGGRCPRFFVWENVPGAFSSNRGMDFRAVLEEIGEASIPMPGDGRWASAGLVELPECQIAWRVLDAQYWGVPQRRKRIFLVADFAERKRRAGEILFERQSLFRHLAKGGKAREGTSAGTESGAYIPSKARSLTARADGSPCIDRGPQIIAASGVGIENDVAGTLDASYYKGQGQRGGIERTAVCVASGNCQTLNARMGMGGNQVPVIAIEGNGARPSHHGDGWSAGGKSFTLNTVDRHAVCVGNGQLNQAMRLSDKARSLDCMHDQQAVMVKNSVRRLTPLECERLQGLPEVWEVNTGMMTNDEYIAFNLAVGNIFVDCNTGDVFATRGPGGITLDTPKKLRGCIINGYLTFSIRNGLIKKPCRANRIVWISANGVIPEGMVVDHINNNKLDNRLSNLQLLSPEENSHKAKRDGLYLCGEANPQTKLSSAEKVEIFVEYKEGNTSYSKLAEKYNVSKGRIAQIIKRDNYTLIDHKTCSDTARYKALGNAMAMPCADFVIRRIVEVCNAD